MEKSSECQLVLCAKQGLSNLTSTPPQRAPENNSAELEGLWLESPVSRHQAQWSSYLDQKTNNFSLTSCLHVWVWLKKLMTSNCTKWYTRNTWNVWHMKSFIVFGNHMWKSVFGVKTAYDIHKCYLNIINRCVQSVCSVKWKDLIINILKTIHIKTRMKENTSLQLWKFFQKCI